jgi:nickel-dependent lactate racemase
VKTQTVRIHYGRTGLELKVPTLNTTVLEPSAVPALPNPAEAISKALSKPIGSPSLSELLNSKKPRTVAITISDITRPVPNRDFLPVLLKKLNENGIADSRIVIIIGTGMHRSSTAEEREILVGNDILRRIEVIDHTAGNPESTIKVSDEPPVSICRRFVEADFRIVTGYIEPHFMAGFSGGRKGVCPALADLKTIQRFHGFTTLSDSHADNGVLQGNPCHQIALSIARKVGVDFLFNVTITKDRKIAGVYCGDLEEAHLAGCNDVAKSTSVEIHKPFDLVITSGGGYPLDQTFYQTVKGMCSALPALDRNSTLLMISHCGEGIGSKAYSDLMLRYRNDWQRFMKDIELNSHETQLDQWEFQMQARVLDLIGIERLWFASDGIPLEDQKALCATPLDGHVDLRARVQCTIDAFLNARPNCRIAVIPDGPYTMLIKKAPAE